MPTVAMQPSLRTTQAVGAILMHQFARERFLEAGLDEELIKEAETRERVGTLTADLLEKEYLGEGDQSNTSENLSDLNESNSSDRTLTDSPLHSHHEESGGERFHSIAETTNIANDNTVYHSMNAGHRNDTPLDKAQSMRIMASYGRELRKIAEEFEKTKMRLDVKDRANKISLMDLNRETFHKLLEELFQDGVTRVKIVTLFFFCTDVALRAVSFAQELVVKLLGWSFSYIINTLCRFVHELGGWENVLFRQVPSLLISCCAILGMFALTVYLRKSLMA